MPEMARVAIHSPCNICNTQFEATFLYLSLINYLWFHYIKNSKSIICVYTHALGCKDYLLRVMTIWWLISNCCSWVVSGQTQIQRVMFDRDPGPKFSPVRVNQKYDMCYLIQHKPNQLSEMTTPNLYRQHLVIATLKKSYWMVNSLPNACWWISRLQIN